jgi:hypothetical protein
MELMENMKDTEKEESIKISLINGKKRQLKKCKIWMMMMIKRNLKLG